MSFKRHLSVMLLSHDIPETSQNASFRVSKQLMFKAHLFIDGVSLKIDVTKSIIYSGISVGLV